MQHQQKVTVQVPVGSRVSNNSWAWRKYGQKPIKSSPFPRRYYRCSTRKDCPVRKHVEKSWTNPSMCNVTYSSDHNHYCPIYRNSLSGCPRSRPPYANGASSSSGLSFMTPLTTSPISADEDKDEDEEEEDGTLHVDDMEIVGPDKLLFLGDSSKAPEPVTANSGCFGVLEDDPFFTHDQL